MPYHVKKKRGRPSKYAFDAIREGGRKFVSAPDKASVKRVQNAAKEYARFHDIVLKTRKTDDGKGVEIKRPRPEAEK